MTLGADAGAASLGLAAQSLHAVLLVGEDIAGERQARIEPQVREGSEHGARVGVGYPSGEGRGGRVLISADIGPRENAGIQCVAALISVETHR